MTPPTIVSAGAGSGKTYRIADEVEALVVSGVPVDRIGAVTFTDAAAAELQERIRERLVERGLVHVAERLDAAPIRTIHSFALSLLTDNPVEAGLSPEPLVLGDVESAALLARAVNTALADEALRVPILTLTRRYYESSAHLRKSAEEFLRDDAKRICDHLRSLRATAGDRDATIAVNAADLAVAFGPPGDPAELDAQLRDAAASARQFLADFPEGKGAGDRPHAPKLRRIVDAIFSPGPDGPDLDIVASAMSKWSKANKRFKEVAAELRAAADGWLRRHPRSLERVQEDAKALLTVAFGVLDAYGRAKAEAGALDYEDMQALALDLLERDVGGAPFAEYVAARLPHLVVDEFQDTSPLQFRIAETLRAHGTKTVYVGDPRQGIYAFRGADSHLLAALEEVETRAGRAVQRLEKNWRSRPELVELVNAIFSRLFPRVDLSYAPLTAAGPHVRKAIAKAEPCVDVVGAEPDVVLGRIREILSDASFRILDRRTEELRRPVAGDVAILCRTNAQLDGWAKRLREEGLRFVRELQGWSNALEVRLARAAITAIANPLSSADLAAVLASEVYGLSQRDLAALATAGLFRAPRRLVEADDAALDALALEASMGEAARDVLRRFRDDFKALQTEARRRTLPDFVQGVVERLRLEDCLAAKGGGAQSRANLVRLVEHARAFVGIHERGLDAVGATGTTLENFLYYLDAVVAAAGDAQPEPLPDDDGAVKLVSFHGAKGLEWPIVVLPSLAASAAPQLARFEVVRPAVAEELVGPRIFELSRLRVFPSCAGEALATDLAAAHGGAEAARADAARLLYVALTRAREHVVLGWDEGAAPDTIQALLEDAGEVELRANALMVGGTAFSARTATPAGSEPPAPADEPADREEVRRALMDGGPLAHDPAAFSFLVLPAVTRSAETSPTELCHVLDDPEQARLARRCANARYPAEGRKTEVVVQPLASGTLRRATTELDPAELGHVVHLALAVADVGFGGRPDAELREILRRRIGVREHADDLVTYCIAAVANVRALGKALGATSATRELPFVLPRGGHRITGAIDLALLTPAGWHVVDHKVHPIAREHVPKWAAFYEPQLESYALALGALSGRPVVGRHLAFHTTGVLATYQRPIDETRLDELLRRTAQLG
jgi:ATP-dependent exoDNAse (exonuclease V) beta subunit